MPGIVEQAANLPGGRRVCLPAPPTTKGLSS